ncbi:hypothetical protein LMH73_028385 [Vibrio splendidus]|nr:hypothetical protein [Vibrio splendidus]MCC4880430.1 hypothetical protein [Vibrio splendidus]
MNAKLKVFRSSNEWLSNNLMDADGLQHRRVLNDQASSISAESLSYEMNVAKERISAMLDSSDLESIDSLDSPSKKTVYKLFLYKGYVLGAKVTGDNLLLYTPMGVSPDRLTNLNKEALSLITRMPSDSGELAGRIVAHYTDMAAQKSYGNDKIHAVKSKMISSYLGRALYASKTLKSAVNVRNMFKDSRETEFQSNKGVSFFQVKPGANIVSSDNPVFLSLRKDMDKDHFSILLKIKNIDGVYDSGLGSLAIHNPDAIDYVDSFKSSDLVRLVERVESMGMRRESLSM